VGIDLAIVPVLVRRRRRHIDKVELFVMPGSGAGAPGYDGIIITIIIPPPAGRPLHFFFCK